MLIQTMPDKIQAEEHERETEVDLNVDTVLDLNSAVFKPSAESSVENNYFLALPQLIFFPAPKTQKNTGKRNLVIFMCAGAGRPYDTLMDIPIPCEINQEHLLVGTDIYFDFDNIQMRVGEKQAEKMEEFKNIYFDVLSKMWTIFFIRDNSVYIKPKIIEINPRPRHTTEAIVFN